MIQTLKNLIPESVKDAAKNTSSTRIQSYMILGLIYLFGIFIISNETIMLIHAIKSGVDYKLSNQMLITFGSLLTHHALMLGINKNSKAEPKHDQLKS